MPKHQMTSRVEDERFLVLERLFDAPRSLVFQMYSKAEHLKHWWGPKGWTVPVCRVDFRAGGVWHYCMKCVDKDQGDFFGMESWGKAVYEEIVEPERIVYTDYFSDEDGGTNEDLPATTVTLSFIDLGSQTQLINRCEYVSSDALKTVMDMGMLEGIAQVWDRLEERLARP